MPYFNSPFGENFNTRVITCLKNEGINDQIDIDKTLKWLCTSPKITSYRVNTLKFQRPAVAERIQEQLDQVLGVGSIAVEYSDILCDVILIKHIEVDLSLIRRYTSEVVIDVDCAAAVLRGAHIYAPGVLAMVSGTQVGERVSIFADLSKKCKKGLLKVYLDEQKVFIGNGVVKMTRKDLFQENLSPKGIAIEVSEVLSGCPSLGNFLPLGCALLQNLPSILCGYVLNPRINDFVLDMCACPGNKTTHIAALMQNKGTLIAIDKLPRKVEQLRKTCKDFGASVLIFQADSCKIVEKKPGNLRSTVEQGPPFPPESFDKILLDAPCSVLGKRPQFSNTTTEKVIRSYVPLQRKLFTAAIALLKSKGVLVYSTCTVTLAENEGIVSWALRTFDQLDLIKPDIYFGEPGWPGASLSEEERCKVQRFGPDQKFDSVGFFIACFVKR